MRSKLRSILATPALYTWIAAPAAASFTTWEVNEVFSNADGSVQFIEFVEGNGQNGQRSFDGKQLKTFASGAPPNSPLNFYNFTDDLPSDLTANKFALIATQGFANLPGAVQPDYVMPDGFVDLSQVVEIELGTIDEFMFSLGAIPTDGINSLNGSGSPVAVNSPTNFAGQTGSIDLLPMLSTWEVNEVYSNADGTIQFIELFEAAGEDRQQAFTGEQLKTFAVGSPSSPASTHDFMSDLSSDETANEFVLIATSGFASVPGAVQPDYVMPDGFVDASTVVEIELGNFDQFTFSQGAIPTDGVNSLHRVGTPVGVNSPTNFAGQAGSIDLPEVSTAALGTAALSCIAALRMRATRRAQRRAQAG